MNRKEITAAYLAIVTEPTNKPLKEKWVAVYLPLSELPETDEINITLLAEDVIEAYALSHKYCPAHYYISRVDKK